MFNFIKFELGSVLRQVNVDYIDLSVTRRYKYKSKTQSNN